jgi:histidine triad (HIT) family protein
MTQSSGFAERALSKDKHWHVLHNGRFDRVGNMVDCVFCKIAKGVVPASVVYSDENVMAFLDIQPVNTGHVLIIPRTHARELSELDPEIGGQMFKVAMLVAKGLRKSGLKCEGISMFLADGEAAFQEIFHVHLHVIPRFRGDGFGLKFGSGYGKRPERKELDTIAGQIRKAIRK